MKNSVQRLYSSIHHFVSILILREIPNRFAVVGSILSFCLLYVIGRGDFSNLTQLAGHSGDLIMVLAVFFYAFYGVFLKKWQLKVPLLLSLYVQIALTLVYHLPFVLYYGIDAINQGNVASVLYAGILPLVAPLLWMMAVQYLGPNRTSIFMNLMPVFTAIIAYFWLHEAWTMSQYDWWYCHFSGNCIGTKKSLSVKKSNIELKFKVFWVKNVHLETYFLPF